MIDLHIHTDASADGQYPPDRIVTLAKQIGLSALAFADHNGVGSVAEGRRLCAKHGIDFVEAIELNTDYDGRDLHLLGYGVNPGDPVFVRWLAHIEALRENQTRAWAQNLQGLGLVLDYTDVAALSPGRTPTGSSFLRVLSQHPENDAHPLVAPYLPGGDRADNPYVNFYFEVLADGPAKSDTPGLTCVEAIARLGDLGALSVLAHPADTPPEIILDLIRRGLRGIEAASSYHDEATTLRHLNLAKKHDLLVTAGSDYHGPRFKKQVKLGDIRPNDRSFFDELIRALDR